MAVLTLWRSLAAIIGGLGLMSAVGAPAGAGTSPGAADQETCPPKPAKVVKRNAYTVVYEEPDVAPSMSACDPNNPSGGSVLGFVQRPSLTLRGRDFSYAEVVCDFYQPQLQCATTVGTGRAGVITNFLWTAASFANPFITQTIPTASPKGVVWIACSAPELAVDTGGGSFPRSCLRGDRYRVVYLATVKDVRDPTKPPAGRVLDRGHGIKAQSLKIKNGRVYWTHSGKRRSAQLAPQ